MAKDIISETIDAHLLEENERLRSQLDSATKALEATTRKLERAEAQSEKLAKDYWPQVGLISVNLAEVAGTLKQMLKHMQDTNRK